MDAIVAIQDPAAVGASGSTNQPQPAVVQQPLPAVIPPPRAQDDRGFFKKIFDVPDNESSNEEDVVDRPPRAHDGRNFLLRALDIPEPEVHVEENIVRPPRAEDRRNPLARMIDVPTDEEPEPLVPPAFAQFIASGVRKVKTFVRSIAGRVAPARPNSADIVQDSDRVSQETVVVNEPGQSRPVIPHIEIKVPVYGNGLDQPAA